MKFLLKLRHFSAYLTSYRLCRNSFYFNSKRKTHKLSIDNQNENDTDIKISTLYVPGRYGSQMYQFVKPLIDVDFIEKNAAQIEKSCYVRGIKLNLQQTANIFKDWMLKHKAHQDIIDKMLECQEEQKRLKELKLLEECSSMDKVLNEYLDQLKIAKTELYNIEDIMMPLAQKIPNIIDKSTPVDEDCITICIEPYTQRTHSHVEIARVHSLLEFTDVGPSAYYFKGPLADLELHSLNYFSEKLQKELYAPMACVDFCKSFISEATGRDPHSFDECIPLKNTKSSKSRITQKYHLVGGASFESFCAYLTNMNTSIDTLPAKYFSIGRHYEAKNRFSSRPSLFSVVQSSRIHGIILCDSSKEGSEFQSMIDVLCSVYKSLKIPFRTVNIRACHLNIAESQRVQLELWSPGQSEFIPVAYVSQRNDFVSKRLNITLGVQHTINGYCSIVEGVVVNVPALLGCLIENFVKLDESNGFDELFKLFDLSK